MKTKYALTLLLALAGEALIIAFALVFFGSLLTTQTIVLDIFVVSVIFWLFFIDLLRPLSAHKDPSDKWVGNLGIRWFFTILYDVMAIAAVIAFGCLDISFKVQLMVQIGLLLGVLFGLILAYRSGEQTQMVWNNEQQMLSGRESMRQALQELRNISDLSEAAPQKVKDEIASLFEEIRYVTPSKSPEALDLEHQFVDLVRHIQYAFTDYDMNREDIDKHLIQCKHVLRQRKSIYSN